MEQIKSERKRNSGKPQSEAPAFGFDQLCDEHTVQVGKGIVLPIDQHIFIDFGIVYAIFLGKIVALQQFFRQGRHPHKGFRIFGQKIELAASFKKEDPPFYIFAMLLLHHNAHRKRGNIGIAVGNFHQRKKIRIGDDFFGSDGAGVACDQSMAEFGNDLVGKPFFFQHFLKIFVKALCIADDAEFIIGRKNVADGVGGIGFHIKQLSGIAADFGCKTGKSV